MKNLIPFAALLFMALSFIQCKSDDEEVSCICTADFNPVCGEDGVQYSNACHAECEGVQYTPGFCPQEKTGLILDLGDPALDGCGWVIEMTLAETVGFYRPDTLAQAFMVDSLPVKVHFKETLNLSPCGLAEQIPVIEVLSMSEQ